MSLVQKINAVKDEAALKSLISDLDNRNSVTTPELSSLRALLLRSGNFSKASKSKLEFAITAFAERIAQAEDAGVYDEDDYTNSGTQGQANVTGFPSQVPVQPKGIRQSSVPTDLQLGLVTKKIPLEDIARTVYNHSELDSYCGLVDVSFGEEDDLAKMMAAVMYIGFMWSEVFSKLRLRAMTYGISKALFVYHMRVICAVYVERGSAFFRRGISNLQDRSVKAYLTSLISLYDIVLVRPANGYSADDVTVTRIVAIFPDIVAKIMKKFNKRPIAFEVSPEVKSHLKFPGGASLIPRDNKSAYEQWLVWYAAFGKVVNPGREVKEADVRRYGDAIFASDVTSAEKRREVFNL